jgi:hypothetical protein
LFRGPHVRAESGKTAGVRIMPFFGVTPASPGAAAIAPPPATPSKTPSAGRLPVIRYQIMLVVDGNIVDLNRIPLPADTPIIDERFKDRHP